MAETIKAKKQCCKARKRCKRCAVVLTRLEKEGYTKRLDKRRFVVLQPAPKRRMKAVRAR